MQPTDEPLPDFETLLRTVLPGVSGVTVVGATLGNLLRQAQPDFHPSLYGASSLKELLARHPELGRVEQTDRSPDLVFVRRDEAPSSTPAPERTLHGPLWHALVAAHPRNRVFLDLGTGRWMATKPDESPDGAQADPARFLPVPPLPQARMQSWAAEFARTQVDDALADATAELAEDRWFPEFVRALPTADLRKRWTDLHRDRVIHHWTTWATQHGANPDTGFRAQKTSSGPTWLPSRPLRPSESVSTDADADADVDEVQLRAIVHAAVDQMSAEELRALPIPVGRLLDVTRND